METFLSWQIDNLVANCMSPEVRKSLNIFEYTKFMVEKIDSWGAILVSKGSTVGQMQLAEFAVQCDVRESHVALTGLSD